MTSLHDLEHELNEATRVFVSELGARLDAIAHALKAGNTSAARALAHTLRGTAGSYGLHAVSTAAGALEDALAQDTADLGPLLTRLRDALPPP